MPICPWESYVEFFYKAAQKHRHYRKLQWGDLEAVKREEKDIRISNSSSYKSLFAENYLNSKNQSENIPKKTCTKFTGHSFLKIIYYLPFCHRFTQTSGFNSHNSQFFISKTFFFGMSSNITAAKEHESKKVKRQFETLLEGSWFSPTSYPKFFLKHHFPLLLRDILLNAASYFP